MRTLTALGVALVVAALPATALASGPSCGATITRDTTLHRDLTNCPGDGLVIGADDVTLDLNGHTIDGDAAGEDDQGVSNRGGYDRFAVIDGMVREFGIGIYTEAGADDRVSDVNASDNADFGAFLRHARRVQVTRSRFRDNGISSLLLGRADGALVAHNRATGSGGYAFVFFATNDAVVRDNEFAGNAHGMLLADDSARNTIERNDLAHNDGSSIDLGYGTRNVVEWNRLADDGDGIILTGGADNIVAHNLVTGTGFFGDPETGGFGVVLDGGEDNRATGNVVTGGRGPAIFVTTLEAASPPQGNVVAGNVATSRLYDGIRVDGGATGTLIERNVADRNGDDGIDVATGNTVGRNAANRNYDLGIEAAPGAIDGGGNRARGNGNLVQCTNVACR